MGNQTDINGFYDLLEERNGVGIIITDDSSVQRGFKA